MREQHRAQEPSQRGCARVPDQREWAQQQDRPNQAGGGSAGSAEEQARDEQQQPKESPGESDAGCRAHDDALQSGIEDRAELAAHAAGLQEVLSDEEGGSDERRAAPDPPQPYLRIRQLLLAQSEKEGDARRLKE